MRTVSTAEVATDEEAMSGLAERVQEALGELAGERMLGGGLDAPLRADRSADRLRCRGWVAVDEQIGGLVLFVSRTRGHLDPSS